MTITRPPLSPQAQHMTAQGKPTKDFYNWLKQATSQFITASDTVAFLNKTFGDPTDVLGGCKVTLGSDATGDIWYRNSSGVFTRLGIGSTGNVLTVAGGLPSWAAPAPSGLTFLGNVTVSGGAIADTTIIAANNSTYRSFLLVLKDIIPSTNGATIQLQVHSGGSFQSSSYLSTIGATIAIGLQTSVGNADPGLCGELIVSNLASTSVHKFFSGAVGCKNSSGNAAVAQPGGFWNGGTGAIDGFQIIDSVGATDIASGSADIYGLQ